MGFSSKFVPQVRESLNNAVRKIAGGGWTNIDSLLVHFDKNAIFAIEYKDARDLETENGRRVYKWQKQVYEKAFSDDVIVLLIICDGEDFSFSVIAVNQAAREWLQADEREYSWDADSFSTLARKFRSRR